MLMDDTSVVLGQNIESHRGAVRRIPFRGLPQMTRLACRRPRESECQMEKYLRRAAQRKALASNEVIAATLHGPGPIGNCRPATDQGSIRTGDHVRQKGDVKVEPVRSFPTQWSRETRVSLDGDFRLGVY